MSALPSTESLQAQGAFLLILGDKQSEHGKVHSRGVAGLTTPFPVLTGHLQCWPRLTKSSPGNW